MRFQAGRTQDYYYALTAKLTARGQQALAMRAVAVCILTLSLPAVLALSNPLSTRLPGGRWVLIAVCVLCLGLAVPWLRRRWPSRTESRIVVIVGVLVLAVGCTIATDPFAGLLIAVAFPFILGFTALCHSARMMWFTVLVAALTIGGLGVRIASVDVPTVFAVGTPVTLITVVVVVAFRVIAVIGMAEEPVVGVDLVTGLPTEESFYENTATLLGARHRDDDRYLALAVVSIDALGAIAGVHGPRGLHRARAAAAQAVRESVRRDAVVGHVGEGDFVVADTFTAADPAPLVERLRSAIASTTSGITASIGVVTTPMKPLADRPPDDVLDELIGDARAAVNRARQAGGNQAHYRVA